MSNYGDSEKIISDYNRRSSPPPFLLKTHMLIEDPSTDNVISWNSSGTAFVVWQPSEFARDILPKLFKHCNFSSFIRQLNTYGFRKVASGRWEFQNEMFRRGQVELLSQIRRRKATSTKVRVESTEEQVHNESNEDRGSLSTQSSSEDTQDNLREENDRLRKENRVLSVELLDIKSKCKELYDLISIYKNSEQTMEDKTLKLFGVTLKVEADRKRKRSDIFESTCFSLSQTCK